MSGAMGDLLRLVGLNLRDLLPVVGVIAFFQGAVVGEPMPHLEDRLVGALFVLVGLTLFVKGLEMSVFPLGEGLADALANRGSLPLLLAFAFALGFGSTVAEPALAAVTDQAARTLANAGMIGEEQEAIRNHSRMLRYATSVAVGLGVTVGVLRIVKGWPVAWFVLGGYGLAVTLALLGSAPLGGMAFDAGSAATSAINIPLITALGVGLASMIRGRSPLVDGFGLVALASLMPMLTMLAGALILGDGVE